MTMNVTLLDGTRGDGRTTTKVRLFLFAAQHLGRDALSLLAIPRCSVDGFCDAALLHT